jgi:hypothetical protein
MYKHKIKAPNFLATERLLHQEIKKSAEALNTEIGKRTKKCVKNSYQMT